MPIAGDQCLRRKVSIVTGSSRGIGRAIALALADAGARVVLTYVSRRECADEVAQRVEACGGQALVMQADISQTHQVERLFSSAADAFGQIDVLVNNAAAFHPKVPLVELPEDDWDRVIEVNLKGTFLCSQRAARYMIPRGSGVIINVSSTGADQVFSNMGAYSSSKGGINALTQALAVELAPHGIRVNGIAPGHIDTAGNVQSLADMPDSGYRFRSRIPLGRLGYREEIGALAVFLASGKCGYLTGQTLRVDGGITIWQGPVSSRAAPCRDLRRR